LKRHRRFKTGDVHLIGYIFFLLIYFMFFGVCIFIFFCLCSLFFFISNLAVEFVPIVQTLVMTCA